MSEKSSLDLLPSVVHKLIATYMPAREMCVFASTSKYYNVIIVDIPSQCIVIDNTQNDINFSILLNRYSLEKAISLDITHTIRLTQTNWEHLRRLVNLQRLNLFEWGILCFDALIHLKVFKKLQYLYLGNAHYLTEKNVKHHLSELSELNKISIDQYACADPYMSHLIDLVRHYE